MPPERHGTDGSTDAFGRMVVDYHRGRLGGPPRYRRPDGSVTEAHLAGYFEPPAAWPAVERRLLARATGPTLDAGCGAGRHALELQARGHRVLAVDRSPGAVAVARDRGVDRAVVGDLTRPPTDGPFETVLVLGKQLGLGAEPSALRATLTALAGVTRPGGRLLADLDDTTRAAPETRPPGDHDGVVARRFRVEYDGAVGPWTDLLLVDPERCREVVAETPWTLDSLRATATAGSDYGLVLSLPTG